jgi:phosphoribosylcarboxyaminoimidazole (NCAIR) mutase
MKEKKILVLTGSRRDLLEGDQPTLLVQKLHSCAAELEGQMKDLKISFRYRVCSADRTPFLLSEVLNEEQFDAVIYSGGYSLVLGASLQEALHRNRHHSKISLYYKEFEDFLKSSPKELEFFPGLWNPSLVSETQSWLYGNRNWIPTICVPAADSISMGLSSHISVTENPSWCEPRPATGISRSDTALRFLISIAKKPPIAHILFDAECDRSGQGARLLSSILSDFGRELESVAVNGSFQADSLPLTDDPILYIGPLKTGQIQQIDQRGNPVVYCPPRGAMDGTWSQHLEVLRGLDNTVSVGVGAYENAALLVCRILSDQNLFGSMWKKRHAKTQESIMQPLVGLERSEA